MGSNMPAHPNHSMEQRKAREAKRLAKALRDNLGRRKAQARERAGQPDLPPQPGGTAADPV